ncbi:MAG: rhomboid family intramembrane serine protease, partial [Fibrobacter sp.]|nr:rhomboid family intramembrane serine protease [Fibrobacter sp.]
SADDSVADPDAIDLKHELLVSTDYRQIRDYGLVLSSQAIPYRILRSGMGPFEIHVPVHFFEQAKEQLELFQKENPPKDHTAPLPMHVSLAPLWVLLAPVFFTLIEFSKQGSVFREAGIADAEKILSGEWWRVFTALTLHADAGHIMGNLVSGYLILNLLAHRLPLSRMAPLLLIFSGLANACVSLTVGAGFRSLGFSTFVFVALGCLGSVEFRLMPRESHGLMRRFAPWMGVACIAVFTGIGENADVLAHFYGFVAGLIAGFLPRKKSLHWGHKPVLLDFLFVALYFAIFIVCWALALSPHF